MDKRCTNRRTFLKEAGLGASLAMIGLKTPNLLGTMGVGGNSPSALALQAKLPWYKRPVIGDLLMDQRLLFVLDHSWQRMSEISECLDTASRIEAGNIEQWRQEWFRTADKLRKVAETSLAKNHRLSAGESYLRATTYYLAGLIYNESPNDPRVSQLSKVSADCFEKALELLGIPGQSVKIPYENTTLPAYFFRSPVADKKAPVLIVHEGQDASAEDVLFIALESIKRGYHCLLFHHPGQGRALREQGLTFRPDWENVIRPVVDFAIQQPGVDPTRIVLNGLSFGGALVIRASAFEKRIKICIANPAAYDSTYIDSFLFSNAPDLAELFERDPEAFNQAIQQFLEKAPSTYYRWWINSASWKYGASSPADLMTKLKRYTNADIVDKVTCKVLVMDGEEDTFAAGQAKKLYDALTSPKEYMLFTAEDTGLLHDQTGAIAVSSQRMFDWLEDNL